MLILARDRTFPDHDMNARIARQCHGTWWFACHYTTGTGKKKVQCGRLHRISCDGGQHIPLDLAEVALRQAGWHRISNPDDGGWRCPAH